MPLTAVSVRTYHVFVASPGDVNDERQAVREYFSTFNRSFAEPRGFRFEVVDWENYSVAGAGRPQELITRQVLDRYRSSLALVVGIMAQRFGSPSGTHESGTEEEFEWALANVRTGFPELKWFFRDVRELRLDPKNPAEGLAQWQRVQAFRERVETEKTVFARSYAASDEFKSVLDQDLGRWLNAAERPWYAAGGATAPVPAEWPADTLDALSRRLNDDFARHMSVGEDISLDDARARYIQSIVRRRPLSRATPPQENATADDEGPLADFIASDAAPLLVVGAGGSGKTTLLKQLAASGAQRATEESAAPVFVYLRLTGFDRGENAFDALLTLLSLAAQTDRAEFERRWRAGSRAMVILLDGLNEVAAAYRSGCTKALWTLLQNSSPRHRYVITSRPGGELESMAANDVGHHPLRVADLLAFGPQQVRDYLAAQGRSDLQERLAGQLEGLASNPFLLWAIVRTSGESPHVRNRGTLFRALIDDYIFDKRERDKPFPRPTTYNYRLVKQPVLARVALTMIEQGVTDVEDGPALYQPVAEQLSALKRANHRVRALRPGTFMPATYSGEGLVREVVDNGVLVREADRLRFMHESVQEYFAAVACREAAPEELAQRVRPLNLGRLQSRGPTFEMLVTWSGLVGGDVVARLVASLKDRHPLLAAHLAVEAALSEEHLEPLRQHFIALAGSLHEQRRHLATLGLATLASHDPAVVSALIAMLQQPDGVAFTALKSTVTYRSLMMVVASWLQPDGGLRQPEVPEAGDNRVRLLREVARKDPRLVDEVLIHQWQESESQRARLVLLAKGLEQRSRWEQSPTRVRETLTTLASESEVTGDVERSSAIDELRTALDRAPELPPLDRLPYITDALEQSMKEISSRLDEKKKIRATFASLPDDEVETFLKGDPLERLVALEVLVARGAPAAVAPVVSAVLDDQDSNWVFDLPKLPRPLVQARLENIITTLDGAALRRAQELAELVADTPRTAVLTQIFGEGSVSLRTMAAMAAGRSGRAGVELLLTHLASESNGGVIEAVLKALGASGDPVAASALLDLLFDSGARDHWEYKRDDSIPIPKDGWASSIHAALADLGQEKAALDRVEQLIRVPNPVRHEHAIQEAQRWLPSPRAAGILRDAVEHVDTESRHIAYWFLATVGDVEAWRSLLEMQLQNDGYRHAGDAASRAESSKLDSLTIRRMIAVSQSVIRPALTSSQENLRVAAIEMTASLPAGWIDSSWLAEASAAARELLHSSNVSARLQAMESLPRLDNEWASIALDRLTGDSDSAVRRKAHRVLGDRADEYLLTRLRRSLVDGECADARLAARGIKELGSFESRRTARSLAAQYLESEPRPSRIASIVAAAALHSEYDPDTDSQSALSHRVRDVFVRDGLENTWAALSSRLASADDQEREFFQLVVESYADTSSEYSQFTSLAHRLWPEDWKTAARHALLATRDREPASEQTLREFEARFGERVTQSWLGERYEEIGLKEDALRHYRLAIERTPNEALPHFKIGWAKFVEGDIAGSIESTRRALQLTPTLVMAEFNLGLALLTQGDVAGADAAYRHAVALARRQPAAQAMQAFELAIGDLDQFPPAGADEPAACVRASLVAECGRLTADI
jgi:tetratricopeptide (TPR) repeat protein